MWWMDGGFDHRVPTLAPPARPVATGATGVDVVSWAVVMLLSVADLALLVSLANWRPRWLLVWLLLVVVLWVAGLVGALLVTRGLTIWFPILHGVLGNLLVIALAGGRIAYAGGWLGRRAPAAHAPAAGEVASATETAAPPPPAPE